MERRSPLGETRSVNKKDDLPGRPLGQQTVLLPDLAVHTTPTQAGRSKLCFLTAESKQ
jgi:hypothetical protein